MMITLLTLVRFLLLLMNIDSTPFMFGVALYVNGVNLLQDETYVNLKIQKRVFNEQLTGMSLNNIIMIM